MLLPGMSRRGLPPGHSSLSIRRKYSSAVPVLPGALPPVPRPDGAASLRRPVPYPVPGDGAVPARGRSEGH